MKFISTVAVMAAFSMCAPAAEVRSLKLLFLGDEGHHRPALRYRQLVPALAPKKIDLVYTDQMSSLNEKTLSGYDGLVVYANIDNIGPDQAKALLDYVASGKGFIPLHCASFCFRNNPEIVALIGAQFQRHGTGVFRVAPTNGDHPITRGFSGFSSWDETYVHTKHNEKDRTVLEYREDREGKEPWTWVRTHGKGRVFYTAWGHDERTWSHDGFVNLIERGIRWACNDDPAAVPEYTDSPKMVGPQKETKPFEYTPAKVPFYPPGGKGGGPREPLNKMQKPLPPEESAKHYQYPEGMELKLFASEPHFGGKPIAINWDERGRLWVCVTVDYPNEMQREGEGRDKIVICEDTNGDGVADSYSVFADKLSIPTSITFAFGGVVIHQAPHTLFLKDTDGDGKADVRQVLFSGWGTGDTHAGPSNLRYGPDGWYYGMCGYSAFNGEVAGEKIRFGQGFYRFKLEQDAKSGKVSCTKLEFLRGTNNNSWGVGFSEDGLLFGSTANGCPSVYLPIPNRYYERVRGWSSSVLQSIAFSNQIQPITENIRQVDWHHGFTAAAGHALYTARAYPSQYWNRTAFVSEPTGHLTATLVLQKYGTDFQARYGWNLVAGVDEWISPIVAEVGPDGSMWIVDWYAFIVQHNPTPVGFKNGKGNAYETDLRDTKHGRIYRLVPKNAKLDSANLANATDAQLVATLKHPTMLWRQHAQRLLTERGAKAAIPAIAKLVEDTTVDAVGLNVGAIHAIWSLQAMGAIEAKVDVAVKAVTLGTQHPSPGVRRAAALAMEISAPSASTNLNLLNDSDPQVRLAALLRLAESSSSEEAGKLLAKAVTLPENLNDRWLPDALTAAASAHDLPFLAAIAPSSLAPRALAIVAVVAEHTARRAPDSGVDVIVNALKSADPKTAETIVVALAKGWPKGKSTTLSAATEKSLAELLPKLPAGAKGQMVRLATAWGSKAFEKYTAEIARSLSELIANEKETDEQRASAARQLTEFMANDDKAVETILDAITPRAGPALVNGLIESLANSTAASVGPGIAKRYSSWSPLARAAALRTLLSRPETTRALLDATEKGQMTLVDLALDQKQALATHPDKGIAARAKAILAKGGGLPNADRQKVIDELFPKIKEGGDAIAGKEMFKKHCSACHQHSGEGNKIGPDLTGMAVHPREEIAVHVLDPSRSVEGNFRLYKVSTLGGKSLSGMLASETKTSIELIDAQAKRTVVLRDDIDTLESTTKSLMPDGFEKQMTPAELQNLMAFLTKRGKYLPVPLDKVATIVSTKGMFYSEASEGERMVFADWAPKTFEGVPFILVDPQVDRVPNVVMLNSTLGAVASKMPKSVSVPVNAPARTIHLLSGVSGWGFPYGPKGSTSLIVRLKYDDGKTEDHALKNGEHFSDYIRRVDVPGSKFAFNLRGKQLRYLTVQPGRPNVIKSIDLVKGSDTTAPIVVALTVEGNE